MEQEQDKLSGSEKNKGGRPKKIRYYNHKLTLYLSDEEYSQLEDFLRVGWYDFNHSAAGRFLLLHSLQQWIKKGKKKAGFLGEFK